MPFFAGVQMPESEFLQTVYPKMRLNQRNRILLVFLDSNNVSPYEFDPHDMSIPYFNGVWQGFLHTFSKYNGIKKSKYFDLEKKKSESKNETLHFKMKGKPEKKAKRNKAKPQSIPIDIQISIII